MEIVVKEEFRVVGIEGQGDASKGFEWIAPLWKAFMPRIDEVKSQVTNFDGVWGAMTDIDMNFNKWDKEGKYIVGLEVSDEVKIPDGMVAWNIPSFRYVVAKTKLDQYGDTFNYVLNEYFIANGYGLAGAVHEYYDSDLEQDEVYLYFPIDKL